MGVSSSGPTPAGKPQVKSLNCPGCGASLTVRSFNHAVSIVCGSCHSILDAQDPNLKILQKFEAATGEDPPLIPLGTRGSLRGTVYEAIGFQRRTIRVEDVPYSWHEYVLFNPYKGFRYLTEYNGHWNDVSILRSLPELGTVSGDLTYLGEIYKHFQSANAATSFVLGEFPWQVRVGETADVADYISPPRVISSERTGKEITWSLGEYVTGRDIWQAFKLQGQPPAPVGVYENQPSPVSANVKMVWGMVAAFVALLVALLIGFNAMALNEQVFANSYLFDTNMFDTNSKREASFVTESFELKGHTSNVELITDASVYNNWIYFDYALINQDTGQAYDFGREVSYYYGTDEDGAWSEGSGTDRVTVPSVPPGTYYLRVEPESPPWHGTIQYTITIKRDVPQASFFLIGVVALLIPAGLVTWRSMNFEHLRWAESDSGGAPEGTFLSTMESAVDNIKSSRSGDDE
jgi:hypothetical protein